MYRYGGGERKEGRRCRQRPCSRHTLPIAEPDPQMQTAVNNRHHSNAFFEPPTLSDPLLLSQLTP
ncbi:hypothetical protein SCLCIDRAFT_392513 [Scleroderma citrinum Foug A]|uniref:Uncharacterized protein n=1 Tax=Scleroderma citrinum Foug A TaxID=1036808 RepID=A0A0C3DDP0_9AGAM|nr:hypothetical protein SCLCIDRAFT_392513 [Scleroderma citrinum Foug A]